MSVCASAVLDARLRTPPQATLAAHARATAALNPNFIALRRRREEERYGSFAACLSPRSICKTPGGLQEARGQVVVSQTLNRDRTRRKSMHTYAIDLLEIHRSQIALVGGKGAHLGELSRIDGIHVPAGFCVTTDAFRRSVDELGHDAARPRSSERNADDRADPDVLGHLVRERPRDRPSGHERKDLRERH